MSDETKFNLISMLGITYRRILSGQEASDAKTEAIRRFRLAERATKNLGLGFEFDSVWHDGSARSCFCPDKILYGDNPSRYIEYVSDLMREIADSEGSLVKLLEGTKEIATHHYRYGYRQDCYGQEFHFGFRNHNPEDTCKKYGEYDCYMEKLYKITLSVYPEAGRRGLLFFAFHLDTIPFDILRVEATVPRQIAGDFEREYKKLFSAEK